MDFRTDHSIDTARQQKLTTLINLADSLKKQHYTLKNEIPLIEEKIEQSISQNVNYKFRYIDYE